MKRYAAVDIGTNTVLLLLAEQADNGELTILRDEHGIARLGEGVDEHRNISPAAIERAQTILQNYRRINTDYYVATIDAVATSAVRDAGNRDEILRALGDALGSPVRVISGEEEARLSFLGSAARDTLCTVIDIGGGSTEYITGQSNDIHERTSLDIGAVRLTERWFSGLPPMREEVEKAREDIRRHLQQLRQTDRGELIGVGGTFTTLAAMDLELDTFDANIVHGHQLTLEAVSRMTEYLVTSPLKILLDNPAIHPKRADILPMGALILEESLKFLDTGRCTASTRGLRYGVLLNLLATI
jgi:exopolyphosphatase/guanosine-5'-triphosphate,3'-diphosphate pyrophosphatase